MPNAELPSIEFQQAMNPTEALSGEGVHLDELPVGTQVDVHTANRCYHLENRGEGKVLISGHPQYCPRPVMVDFHGSTLGSSTIKLGFVGTGMRLEFEHPVYGSICTSRVLGINLLG